MKRHLLFRRIGFRGRALFSFTSFVAITIFSGACRTVATDTLHVWEKVEITLRAEKSYQNPYQDVEVWVDLKGPGFDRRCHGFWDGDDLFRVRVMASAAGTWTWISGSNQSDPGLNGRTGKFTAVAWVEAEKEENPSRRGIIKASANGHAFEYADGAPFFLMGDTWWPTPTFRFPWYDDDQERPIGPQAGFKDYVRFRRKQGYNCIAMVAALPNWANDDKPATLKISDGMVLRSAWQQAGTGSAKDMRSEDGQHAFLFPGKVPGYENYFPDVDRINPEYFHALDRKIDYLNAQGFIPFIEVARRDIGPAWKKYYDWPESYTRYIQYVWSRYQANICFFSPIHFDWSGSLPADDWNTAANKVIEKYGPPPFGTPVSSNPTGSTLENFGHTDSAKWLSFHQIGNFHQRDGHGHRSYHLLTDIFNASPPVPAINGEPYYDGQHGTIAGTPTAALYSRSAMYGSVLSGGLGGHIYGAGREGKEGGAIWGGNVEEAANKKIWDGMEWESGDQMRHLRTFVFSEGRRYRELVPGVELVSPNKSGQSNDWLEWAYCARTANKDFFLLYFEKGCNQATLSGALPKGAYKASWFNPRTGDWIDADGGTLTADPVGRIVLPDFPGASTKSGVDWGLRLVAHVD